MTVYYLAGTVDAVSTASAVKLTAKRALAGTVDAVSTVDGFLEKSVGDIYPGDGDVEVPPGSSIAFNLYGAGRVSRVWDFDNGLLPPELELCTPANGYTESHWNGGADYWDFYNDGADDVLRAQGRASAVFLGSERAAAESWSIDVVCRVRWYTGARAGLAQRVRTWGTYPKTTVGFSGVTAEIDSGGFRLCYYLSKARNVRETAAFSPVSGTWYWLRLRHQSGAWGFRYVGKYWTGTRDSEPSSWSVAWHSDGLGGTSGEWSGIGLRVDAGQAYFDDFEVLGELEPTETSKLTVEVNSIEHSVENGKLRIEPFVNRCQTGTSDRLVPALAQNWYFNLRGYVPDLNIWRVWVNAQEAYDADDDQAVVVKWDGDTIRTWSFETSSFPFNYPALAGAGDPDRMGSFRNIAGAVEPDGRRFLWLIELFLETMGRQELKFAIAPIGWRSFFEEFTWIAIAFFYIPVDGEYTIAHPIESITPASLIPGELVQITIPSSVIPKGSLERAFPSSLIVQGYRRIEHPAGIIVGIRFFYRGKASGIVGEELLARIKASGITLETNEDNELELHVQDEETFQALLDLGVTWT
ncbi:MAG: hypothetical protein AMS19_02615 [Gemmatimonas sp. SG8_23]|nr:MAG: hypothetical protein AMS19_02615 [Gemmatimonas sp. SG8_23]